MKLILMIIGIIVLDRAFPYGAWRYGAHYFKITERELLQRYGLFSFPRTLLAVAVCITAGLDLIVPIDQTQQGVLMLIFTAMYCVSASVDVWRAVRSGGT